MQCVFSRHRPLLRISLQTGIIRPVSVWTFWTSFWALKNYTCLLSHEWKLHRGTQRGKKSPTGSVTAESLRPRRTNKSWELRKFHSSDKQRHETGFKASYSTNRAPFQTCEQPVHKGKINLAQTRHSKPRLFCRTLVQHWQKRVVQKREHESNTRLLACIYVDNLLLTLFKVALNGTLQSISTGRI